MAFDTYETSSALGRPVALYEFRWGTVFWRYTSADSVQTYGGNDFLPVSIRDEGMTQGGSSENDFTIHAQSDLEIVELFADSAPTSPTWLTVRRKHDSDPDDEAPVYFVGRVANVVGLENPAESDIRAVAISKLLSTGGLRLTWGKNCPHCIYDSQCTVDPLEHEYPATVVAIAGPLVTYTTGDVGEDEDGEPIPLEGMVPTEGTFTGGYVSWDRSGEGTLERRGIEVAVSSTQIKVLGRCPGLSIGDTIKVYPGCDQTTSTCEGGFDNLPNNGGYSFMPEKSPFDGTQVFD